MVNSLKSLLARWKNLDYISFATYRTIYCSDGILPRAYGLPKIYELNCQFRVIISCIDSPLYPLTTFLHKIINSNLPKADSHINNSYELFENLSDKGINNGYCLILLDVISLFTNVFIDLVIECLTKRYLTSTNYIIPQKEFLDAVRLVLDSTFFTFDNQYYNKTLGRPWVLLSPWLLQTSLSKNWRIRCWVQ